MHILNLQNNLLILNYIMKRRMVMQIRAIKRFAKSHHINNLDEAAIQWVITGCAEQWSKHNP